MRAGQPDQAGQTYRRMLAYLRDQPETEWTRASIAVIYHQLGMTAQDCGRLDEAEDWYRRSLAINEELGNRPGLAVTLWVPIVHPCWSGSMSVLVEGAAEPVPSADVEVRDPLRIGSRSG
jgi:Tetratricopeptide repeat